MAKVVYKKGAKGSPLDKLGAKLGDTHKRINEKQQEDVKIIIEEALDKADENQAQALNSILTEDLLSQVTEEQYKRLKESKTIEQVIESIGDISTRFRMLFSDKPLSNDPEILNSEAKYLSVLSGLSFIQMSKRLIKIREEKLYKQLGYDNFEKYIVNELELSKPTVYEYIKICEVFSESGRPDSDIEVVVNNRSKFIPFIPIINSAKANDKNRIIDEAINIIPHTTRKDVRKLAKLKKIEYNIDSPQKIKIEKEEYELLITLIKNGVKKQGKKLKPLSDIEKYLWE